MAEGPSPGTSLSDLGRSIPKRLQAHLMCVHHHHRNLLEGQTAHPAPRYADPEDQGTTLVTRKRGYHG